VMTSSSRIPNGTLQSPEAMRTAPIIGPCGLA
jgi:hypothetical protein